jgi:hypothetical protein
VIVGVESALMLVLLIVGLRSLDVNFLQMALLLSQLCGVNILSAIGLCCGIGGGIVLMDYSVGHLGPLTVVGVPLLFLANVLGLYLLIVAVVTFRESLRAHRRHAGNSAAVA